jgi:choline dehydrogenase-like flavoprotein
MTRVDGRELRRDTALDADVVIVGSGPAGAAVARVVSASGASVLVLEAGPWFEPADFALSAFSAMSATYRDLGGSVAVGRAFTPLVQGRMVGGSSPINGAICWRTPRDVYDAWVAADPALADALPWAALERATDTIEARLGVAPTDPAVAGAKERLMARAADLLGLEHRPIRRNVVGCEGRGRCLQGCPTGAKQSVDRTLLADALAAGATVASSVEVDGVVVQGGRATGVEGRAAGGGRVRARARRAVVVAASAIQSPALLLASGLTHGPVGHGFQAHPGVALLGTFPEPIRCWEGATQGHEITGLRREGLKFETLGMDLTVLAARLDGYGASLARQVADLDHVLEWGAAVRSTTRGRVRRVLGRTVVTWGPSPSDLAAYRRALQVMGELMFAVGATSVSPGVRGLPGQLHDVDALRRALAAAPAAPSAYRAVITHMFGTARLGSDPATAVVRPDLRHHAIDGLYVADSSAFPTNLGVNPQVPIMALATLCGEGIVASS